MGIFFVPLLISYRYNIFYNSLKYQRSPTNHLRKDLITFSFHTHLHLFEIRLCFSGYNLIIH